MSGGGGGGSLRGAAGPPTDGRGRPPGPGWRRNIAGTREHNSGGLTGVQRILDVFIGGCDKATVCSDITEFCTTNGVQVRECISLPTKAQWYVAFKVSVTASDRDKLLNPEFWPAGVFVRKFLKAKNSSSDA